MTGSLELSEKLEAELVALAQAHGLALIPFVQQLLEEQIIAHAEGLSPTERAAAWRALVEGLPIRPVLSDTAISRDTMYDARG